MTAAQDRAELAVRWLAEHGGVAAPGVLGAGLGLANHARQAEVTKALTAAGWAVRDGAEIRLTPAGWAMVAPADAAGAGDVLARVAGVFPDYAGPHAAFLRLLVSAIIGKARLFDAGKEDGHLSFWAIGPQGAGKTVHAQLACHLLGLDWRRHVVDLDDETAGSLRGRRTADGAGGWRLAGSSFAGLPFVAFDELDKAPDDARKAVWRYVRGKGVVWIEGERHELRPVVMAAANPPDPADVWGLAPEGARRRGVLFAAGYLDPRQRQELAEHLHRAVPALSPRDRLSLDRLPAVPAELEAGAASVLASVRGLVTDELGPLPLVGLELAALGRLALLADPDPVRAVVATAIDYLMVTATTPGLVRDGWQVVVRKWAELEANAGRRDVVAVLDLADTARARAVELASRVALERKAAADALVRDRSEAAEGLEVVRREVAPRQVRSWPAPLRPKAAGLYAQLDHLRDEVMRSRSRQALDELAARCAGPVAEVRRLVDQAEMLRRQKEANDARAKDAREYDRRQRAADKARAVAQLDALMPLITRLERMYRWDGPPRDAMTSPAGVLAREMVPDGNWAGGQRPILRYVPPTVEPTDKLLVSVWRALAPPAGEWFATLTNERVWYGHAHACGELREWGEGTADVIADELDWLYRVEDNLRAAAGRRARTRRAAA